MTTPRIHLPEVPPPSQAPEWAKDALYLVSIDGTVRMIRPRWLDWFRELEQKRPDEFWWVVRRLMLWACLLSILAGAGIGSLVWHCLSPVSANARATEAPK